MRISKTMWITLSGLVWFLVGIGLLTLGLNFIVFKAHMDRFDTTSLIARLSPFVGGREQAALTLIVISLIIGFIKGRYAMGKTAKRVIDRIVALPQPVKFTQVYSRGYLLLILGMITLGLSMKWLGIPSDVRGMIDVAIGSALMNGAMAYFRAALAVRKEVNKS